MCRKQVLYSEIRLVIKKRLAHRTNKFFAVSATPLIRDS